MLYYQCKHDISEISLIIQSMFAFTTLFLMLCSNEAACVTDKRVDRLKVADKRVDKLKDDLEDSKNQLAKTKQLAQNNYEAACGWENKYKAIYNAAYQNHDNAVHYANLYNKLLQEYEKLLSKFQRECRLVNSLRRELKGIHNADIDKSKIAWWYKPTDHPYEELVKLASSNYEKYLKTPHWQQIRDMKLTIHKRCYECGTRYNLKVYHDKYRDVLGQEQYHMEELRVLCRNCRADHREADNKRRMKFFFNCSPEEAIEAGKGEVTSWYRKCAKEDHPDHGGNGEAFRYLKDRYDRIMSWFEGHNINSTYQNSHGG